MEEQKRPWLNEWPWNGDAVHRPPYTTLKPSKESVCPSHIVVQRFHSVRHDGWEIWHKHCNVKFESEVRIKNFAQIPDNVEKAEIGVVSIVPDSIVQKQ